MSIGYLTLGALDLEQACAFYDAVIAPLGFNRGAMEGGWVFYGKSGSPSLGICCPPFNGEPATAGNGVMISFSADSVDHVNSAHRAGLENGGASTEGGSGDPGYRPPYASSGYYAAYLRDPTGNKICVYNQG
jgi:catechol 2,3-dioxygenase-like lactoylglutathione lyase family enzyme